MLYAFVFSLMHATYPACLIPLYLITLITFVIPIHMYEKCAGTEHLYLIFSKYFVGFYFLKVLIKMKIVMTGLYITWRYS